MPTWVRWLAGGLLTACLISATTGCASERRREVRVEERQEQGEVETVGPGEMIVE
jgi:hypothetical protein